MCHAALHYMRKMWTVVKNWTVRVQGGKISSIFSVGTCSSTVLFLVCDPCIFVGGKISSIFSVSTCSSLFLVCGPCIFVVFFVIFLEKLGLSVKWKMCTQRTRHPVQNDGAVENVVTSSRRGEGQIATHTHTDSSVGPSSDTTWQPVVIQDNLLHHFLQLHRFLHRCVQSTRWCTPSSVFFFPPSLISNFLSLFLSYYSLRTRSTMYLFTYIMIL